MKNIRNIFSWLITVSALLMLTCCAIPDDIPFPIVSAQITAFEVEGQCDASGRAKGSADIDVDKRTIELYVDDSVDLSKLRVTRLEVSNDAEIHIDQAYCHHPEIFPSKGFTEAGADDYTQIDCTSAVKLTLHTYQDYVWTIHVHQVIVREVEFENQIGNAVIDPVAENVVVYVSGSQSLRSIKVHKFSLGGGHGSVSPDPTASDTYDFYGMKTFDVKYGWSNTVHKWQVFVYQTDATVAMTSDAFARSVSATISGNKPNGVVPEISYRLAGTESWSVVPAALVEVTSTTYSADVTGLQPDKDYEYQVKTSNETTAIKKFHTATAEQLPNASFDDWSTIPNGKNMLWQPWAEGSQSFWDTGNRGATTVGASNSTGASEGGRKFANLQSKYIVIKFAAGNIFTGRYLKTDGTNGILGFGRPFTSFPTKMQFDYTFHSSPVSRPSDLAKNWKESYSRYINKDMFLNMKGKPDSCQIYVALIGDQDEESFDGQTYPYIIRTSPSDLHLFNPRSDNVIGYGQFTQGNSVSEWTTHTIDITYRHKDRVPKYIIVVASSSKYGDYFVGGDETLLQLDNLKLLYE